MRIWQSAFCTRAGPCTTLDEPLPLHRVLLGGSSTTGVMLSLVAVDKTFPNDRGTIAECDQTGWSSGSEALALSEATSLLAGGAPRL